MAKAAPPSASSANAPPPSISSVLSIGPAGLAAVFAGGVDGLALVSTIGATADCWATGADAAGAATGAAAATGADTCVLTVRVVTDRVGTVAGLAAAVRVVRFTVRVVVVWTDESSATGTVALLSGVTGAVSTTGAGVGVVTGGLHLLG
jgi:hypothetical protein